MRYIAIFLLVANLAYLGWHLSQPPQPQAPDDAARRPLLNTGLTLLREYQAMSEDQAREAAEAARMCTVISGFAGEDEARAFADELAGPGRQPRLFLTGTRLPSQYRVLLPPASSRQVAAITMDGLSERLEQEGQAIETYLITRGALENAIALGVFADQANALRVQQQVQALGYGPQLQEIPRTDGEIQVWLEGVGAESLDESEWLDLSAERPALSRSENLCETIAQAPRIP